VESAGLSLPAGRPAAARAARALLTAAAPVLVVALAAALRLSGLGHVPDNPFYDAAVRSMSLSWHNFLFGAFDPSAHLAVDKPPLDLWLQVASVKAFGLNSFALKLPEAIGGTVAVAILYDLVRRPFGRLAGLVAALALAVLPVAVLTARSDTMDSVMSALMIGALWLGLVGAQTRRAGLLYLAAVAVGLAFNVKLFEALLVVPPLVVLYAVVAPAGARRKLEQLVVAGVVAAVVSLSWATAVSLAPAHDRPYPIGSTDGTVWNAMFVWDGLNRLNGTPSHLARPHHHVSAHRRHVLAVRAQRARADGPGPTRLLQGRLGVGAELVAAVAAGALAVTLALLGWLARLRTRPWAPTAADRGRWGLAAALAVWLALGVVLFSAARTLHPRYLEAITPAIAGVLGIGLVSAVRRLPAARWLQVVVVAVVAAAVLAVPVSTTLGLVAAGRSDSGRPGSLPAAEVARLGAYLHAHAPRTRYELATPEAATAGPIIVRDGRPVLVLLNIDRQPLMSTAALKGLVRRGDVRYGLLNRPCRHRHGRSFSRVATTRWICTHGHDVGRRAGVAPGLLFRLRRSAGA
jgi:4-amino-4-deoxy-L-arabinose transferase-like glycosyltransferase